MRRLKHRRNWQRLIVEDDSGGLAASGRVALGITSHVQGVGFPTINSGEDLENR